MRFLASWWERVPTQHVRAGLVMALALGFGVGRTGDFLGHLLGRLGSYWT